MAATKWQFTLRNCHIPPAAAALSVPFGGAPLAALSDAAWNFDFQMETQNEISVTWLSTYCRPVPPSTPRLSWNSNYAFPWAEAQMFCLKSRRPQIQKKKSMKRVSLSRSTKTEAKAEGGFLVTITNRWFWLLGSPKYTNNRGRQSSRSLMLSAPPH